MESSEQELLHGKNVFQKDLVMKTDPIDTTSEILSLVTKDDHSSSDYIYNVMMQPVASGQKNINSFKCEFCGKEFEIESRLKFHANTHSNTTTGIAGGRFSNHWSNSERLGTQAINATKKYQLSKNVKSGVKMKQQVKIQVYKQDNVVRAPSKPDVKFKKYELHPQKDMESRVSKPGNSKLQSKPKAKLTLKCNFCDKLFASHAHLSRHTNVHTGIRPFKCDKCNKAFKDASVLIRHHRIHSNERPYCCEVCKKSFVQSKDLQHHLRSHRGEQPFQCETCNKCFSSASYLTVHKRTHTGLKPYKCPICNAGFQASGTLSRHKRSHSAEKQYKCSVCPKAFTRSTNLKLHTQAHHTE